MNNLLFKSKISRGTESLAINMNIDSSMNREMLVQVIVIPLNWKCGQNERNV